MDLLERIQNTAFLGEEFLTWLWFRSARDECEFEVAGERVILELDNQMTLEAGFQKAEKTKLSGGAPAESPEAKDALRLGKRLTQAKLRLELADGREWMLTFNAKTMGISGLKVPAVLSKEDAERLYERMDLVDEADAAMRGLYYEFLGLRLDERSWSKELEEIRAFAESPAPD